MATFHSALTDKLIQFIKNQHMFFTATATKEGRINVSPKGMDTFRCLDKHTVAYLDLTGSGNETAAHLYTDGRMTIMFCSFSERPLILRLYGNGHIVAQHHPLWNTLNTHFEILPGTRQIVRLTITGVQTSCGYGVPFYHFEGERPALKKWAEKKGTQGIRDYWEQHNKTSIEGFPTHISPES